MESPKNNKSKVKEIFIDLNAGFVGGIMNVFTGHPFDTVKTRLQTNTESIHRVITKLYKNEGVLSFFKGMSFPLYSTPLLNSLVFSCNELTKKAFDLNDHEMSFSEGFISGAVTGVFSCIVVTPVELVKCRLQLQELSLKESKYKGSLDCLNQVYRLEGIKGVYSGVIITILREVPGYSIQFASYHFIKSIISSYSGRDYHSLSNLSLMLCGGFCGFWGWHSCYPQDVIKTLIQTDITNKYNGSIIKCAKNIYKTTGWYGFYRGYCVCQIRAFFTNSFLFLGYEKSKKLFTKWAY